MIRDKINTSLKQSMMDKDKNRLGTLRLITAAIKDRDIAERANDNHDGVSDIEILNILARMIKQRKESFTTYKQAGRQDLADQERKEIDVIEEFLPKQLSEEEMRTAVQAAITAVGADSIRDMGKVMGSLKAQYMGQMDFNKAGGAVKEFLG